MDVLKNLSQIGIIPVIALDDPNKAVPLAKALIDGGLPAMEITFRTAAGQEAIRKVAKAYPEILLGAGTILTVKQCEEAIEAGAKYIVSPGFFEPVVDYCLEHKIPVLPGCANASEMTKAVNKGLTSVKFFPAEDAGGVKYLKAVASVFPLTFMPTGGVNTGNLLDYISFDRIFACGGTWMVKKDMIESEQFDKITAICKDAVRKMLSFSLVHIGINGATAEEADNVAKTFSTIFGLEYKEGKTSDFAGDVVECMKGNGRGTKGHIAIGTPNVERAVYHLSKLGVAFDETTAKCDAKGAMKIIYLRDEIGGFGVHLLKK